MKIVYGCLQCTYVVPAPEVGKCPSCDSPLGQLVLGEVEVTDLEPTSVPSPPRPDRNGPRGHLRQYYWQVTLNNAGRRLRLNFLAASANSARQRVIRLCHRNGWVVCDLEGNELRLPTPNEPERSIDAIQLMEVPDEFYDENLILIHRQ